MWIAISLLTKTGFQASNRRSLLSEFWLCTHRRSLIFLHSKRISHLSARIFHIWSQQFANAKFKSPRHWATKNTTGAITKEEFFPQFIIFGQSLFKWENREIGLNRDEWFQRKEGVRQPIVTLEGISPWYLRHFWPFHWPALRVYSNGWFHMYEYDVFVQAIGGHRHCVK